MTKPIISLTIPLLALLAFNQPLLAEDEATARTPWVKTDVTLEQEVRWVVEGCAAYPVAVDDPSAELASLSDADAQSSPTPQVKTPADDR